MDGFPKFMKRQANIVDKSQQNTEDIEGYYYEAPDGSQMAFWECHTDRVSSRHSHDFDEYVVCVSGEYVVCTDEGEYILKAGDEHFIPQSMEHWGRLKSGTRTIFAFGGKRVKR